MIQVYTGDGKGKTTAAFGLAPPCPRAGVKGGDLSVFKERGQRGGESRAGTGNRRLPVRERFLAY